MIFISVDLPEPEGPKIARNSPLDVYKRQIQVGEYFKNGEMFVPEVLMCARVMNAATDLLKPYMKEGDAPQLGRCLLYTSFWPH